MTAIIIDFPIMAKSDQNPVNNIRRLRREQGMSAAQLAESVGAQHNTITRLEMGERELTYTWMKRIAAALGTDAGQLLLAEDNQVAETRGHDAAVAQIQQQISRVAERPARFAAENDDQPRTA